MQLLIILIFFLTSLWAGVLKDDYNLPFLTGGPLLSTHSSISLSSGNPQQFFLAQTGSFNEFELGALGVHESDFKSYQATLPLFFFRLHASKGWFLQTNFKWDNAWLKQGDSLQHGLTDEYQSRVLNSWDFKYISNDARIRQWPDTYNVAFFYGPTLNRGQYSLDFGFENVYGGKKVAMISDAYMDWNWGAFDFLQVGFNGRLTKPNQLEFGTYTVKGTSKEGYVFTKEPYHKTWGSHFVFQKWNLRAEALAEKRYSGTDSSQNVIQANLAGVQAKDDFLFTEVEGNYDRYFSKSLKPWMLKEEVSFQQVKIDTLIEKKWQASLWAGLPVGFSLGLDWMMQKREMTKQFLRAGLTWNHIPYRKGGPRRQPKILSRFGFLPQMHEFRVELSSELLQTMAEASSDTSKAETAQEIYNQKASPFQGSKDFFEESLPEQYQIQALYGWGDGFYNRFQWAMAKKQRLHLEAGFFERDFQLAFWYALDSSEQWVGLSWNLHY